jgi:hypothetical protein
MRHFGLTFIVNHRFNRSLAAALLLATAGIAPHAYAQTSNPAAGSEEDAGRQRWATFGVRFRLLPPGKLGIMQNSQQRTGGGSQNYEWLSTTTSRSPLVGVGPSMDLELSKRVTLTSDILFHRLSYDAVMHVYPTGGNSLLITKTETTKASIWDFPVMVHFGGFGSSPVSSRFYVACGAALRTVSGVSTTNKVAYSDGSSVTDYSRAQPTRRNVVGVVAGVGLRFIDDYQNKVTPEIRYTRWFGQSFGTDSTQSPRNQIELNVGLTF